MKCRDCTSSAWQTYEKTYVVSLPKIQQRELNAVVAGASDGIDHDIVVQMRCGSTAAQIQKTSEATLTVWHNQLMDDYTKRCKSSTSNGNNVVLRIFPPLDPTFSAKGPSIYRGYLRDYVHLKGELNREMASLISLYALSIDHQYKVAKKGCKGYQSFCIVGDGGVVLGYYTVPDTNMQWVHNAMMEIVHRHGAILDDNSRHTIQQGKLPPLIFVDTNCCNGSTSTSSHKQYDSIYTPCIECST